MFYPCLILSFTLNHCLRWMPLQREGGLQSKRHPRTFFVFCFRLHRPKRSFAHRIAPVRQTWFPLHIQVPESDWKCWAIFSFRLKMRLTVHVLCLVVVTHLWLPSEALLSISGRPTSCIDGGNSGSTFICHRCELSRTGAVVFGFVRRGHFLLLFFSLHLPCPLCSNILREFSISTTRICHRFLACRSFF
jgi:hypothetical protein